MEVIRSICFGLFYDYFEEIVNFYFFNILVPYAVLVTAFLSHAEISASLEYLRRYGRLNLAAI